QEAISVDDSNSGVKSERQIDLRHSATRPPPRPDLRARRPASIRAGPASLASLGVDPGELAGLELPVTVDVMREHAEFLASLGLTREDLAAYPLALGCSMRKNM